MLAKQPLDLMGFLQDAMRTCMPDATLVVDGASIQITFPPGSCGVVSCCTSPEGAHIAVRVVPREPEETWGDYAKRRQVGVPSGDPLAWLLRLRALAGE